MVRKKKTGRENSSNRVKINFFISYIAVLMLPIALIFSLYYHTSVRILNEEIESSRLAAASQFKKSFDEDIRRSRAIASYLWQNEDLPALYGKTEEMFRPEDVLSMVKISRLLSYYTGTNPFISDIYIRLNESGRIITMQGAKPGFDYFSDLRKQSDDGSTYEDWIRPMTEYSSGRLVTMKSSGAAQNQDLYYMQSMPVLPVGNTDAALVIRFSRERLFSAALPDAVLCVLDESGNLLAGSGDCSAHDFTGLRFDGNTGFVRDQNMIISYAKADFSPLTLISIIPESYFNRRLMEVQSITFVILFACILIGMALTYYFTVRNYNPIRQLLHLTRPLVSESRGEKDPYWEIRTALLDALDEKIEKDLQMRQKQEQDRKRELCLLLQEARCDADRIAGLLAEGGLRIGDGPYCVVSVEPLDYGTFFYEFFQDGGELLPPLTICQNVYTEMLGRRFLVESMIGEKGVLLFISPDSGGKDFFLELGRMIAEAQQFTRDNYSIDTYGGASAVHSDIQTLQSAIGEAEEAIRYLGVAGHLSFLTYEDLSPENTGCRCLTGIRVPEEARFIGEIRAGDFTRARESLNAMIAAYLNGRAQNTQVLLLQFHSLMRDALEAVDALNMPDKEKMLEETRACERILNCGNLSDFHAEMDAVLKEMAVFYSRTEYDDSFLFKQEVIRIVRENYMNYDLNVSFIADALNKNLDYVSRTFKKMTKIGLLDYIHLTRIAKAKEFLLSERNLTVLQISSIVGYLNCDSFIRAFRRKEGMTPGKYREIHSQ